MRFDLATRASPELVRDALTDFGEVRLRTWRRTLDPATYELRDEGEHWAIARESTPRSPFWVVTHYDWSDPDVVRWRVVESSWGGGGDGEVSARPRDGGGSHVHAEWTYTDGPRQRALMWLFRRAPLDGFIARQWAASFDDHADAQYP